jgi:hypothetical protein
MAAWWLPTTLLADSACWFGCGASGGWGRHRHRPPFALSLEIPSLDRLLLRRECPSAGKAQHRPRPRQPVPNSIIEPLGDRGKGTSGILDLLPCSYLRVTPDLVDRFLIVCATKLMYVTSFF